MKYENKYREKIKDYVKKYASEETVNPKTNQNGKTEKVNSSNKKQSQKTGGDNLSETSLNHGDDDDDDDLGDGNLSDFADSDQEENIQKDDESLQKNGVVSKENSSKVSQNGVSGYQSQKEEEEKVQECD